MACSSLEGKTVSSKDLSTMVFQGKPEIAQDSTTGVAIITIAATVSTILPLGAVQYNPAIIQVRVPLLALISFCAKGTFTLDKLNVFLCTELKKQEMAKIDKALREQKARIKEEQVSLNKQKKATQRHQKRTDAKTAAAHKREERNETQQRLRLEKKEVFKKRRALLFQARKMRKQGLETECNKRLQCRILLEKLCTIRTNYVNYVFSGKRPRTSLSMLIFNLERALKTAQPLIRHINSARKHLSDLCSSLIVRSNQ